MNQRGEVGYVVRLNALSGIGGVRTLLEDEAEAIIKYISGS